jgi:hypothetical protein
MNSYLSTGTLSGDSMYSNTLNDSHYISQSITEESCTYNSHSLSNDGSEYSENSYDLNEELEEEKKSKRDASWAMQFHSSFDKALERRGNWSDVANIVSDFR